jgi:hypothetical protein
LVGDPLVVIAPDADNSLLRRHFPLARQRPAGSRKSRRTPAGPSLFTIAEFTVMSAPRACCSSPEVES